MWCSKGQAALPGFRCRRGDGMLPCLDQAADLDALTIFQVRQLVDRGGPGFGEGIAALTASAIPFGPIGALRWQALTKKSSPR